MLNVGLQNNAFPSSFSKNGNSWIFNNQKGNGGMWFRAFDSLVQNDFLLNGGTPNAPLFDNVKYGFYLSGAGSNNSLVIGGGNSTSSSNAYGATGFMMLGTGTTIGTSDSKRKIGFSNATAKQQGGLTYYCSDASEGLGEVDDQTNGYMILEAARDLVITTSGSRNAPDYDSRVIRIGGGWRSHLAIFNNGFDPSENQAANYWTTNKDTTVILGDGYKGKTTDESFLMMQNGRMSGLIGGGAMLAILDNGSVVRQSNPNSASDIRLKKKIQNLDVNLIDKINEIEIIEYKWKENPYSEQPLRGWNGEDGKYIGFKAQQLEKIFPSSVIKSGWQSKKEAALAGVHKYKGGEGDKRILRHQELIPVLVKGIQELSEENKQLKERLKLIEEKLGL
jgi:hypothetical protein